MTDEPKTPGNLTPHIVESLDPCRCPHCGSYATEKLGDDCPTMYDGIPAANERWRCRRCRKGYLALYEGHIHAILWATAEGAGLMVLNEDAQRQNAAELYERLGALSTVAAAINSQQHAGIEVSAEDWSILYSVTNGARRLIDRIKQQALG